MYNITVTSETVSGKISLLSSDEIVVDSVEYKLIAGKEFDISVGQTVTLYLNENGKVASIGKEDLSEKYGYIVKSMIDESGEDILIKMLISGAVVEDVEIDESNEDNKVSKPIIKIRNSDCKTLKLSNKVRVNGNRYSASEIEENMVLNGVFKYKLNSSGEVMSLETPEMDSISAKRTYNSYEKIFYQANESVFAIDDATQVLCIPEDPESISTNLDYLTSFELNNGQSYRLTGYDIREADQTANLIVATIAMDYYAGGAINNSNKIAVADNVSEVVNSDGDIVKNIHFFSEGKEMEYQISNNCKTEEAQARVESIKEGDVFLYKKDGSLKALVVVE